MRDDWVSEACARWHAEHGCIRYGHDKKGKEVIISQCKKGFDTPLTESLRTVTDCMECMLEWKAEWEKKENDRRNNN